MSLDGVKSVCLTAYACPSVYQLHACLFVYLCLSVCLSAACICLSVCLSMPDCLSISCMHICLSIYACLSVYQPHACLHVSVYIMLCLSMLCILISKFISKLCMSNMKENTVGSRYFDTVDIKEKFMHTHTINVSSSDLSVYFICLFTTTLSHYLDLCSSP